MKILSFFLLILYLSLSAKEIGRESGFTERKNVSGFGTETESTLFKKEGKTVSAREQKNWQSSKRVALIVGVSGYPQGSGLARLNFGASDSQKIGSVLKDVGKFEETVILNDEQGKADPRFRPIKENIIRERNRLLSLNPQLFLFYFSGHGFELKGENVVTPADTVMGTGNEEPKNTLNIAKEIIEEAQSYRKKRKGKIPNIESESDEDISPDGAEQIVVFLDACRETMREGKAGTGVKFTEFPERIRNAKGAAILMGTSQGGYSYEDGKLGGGVFTHFIVKGFSGEVQNRAGEYVTFNDLKEYVEKEMADYMKSKGRNEQIPFAKGEYKGDFLLAVGRPGTQMKVGTVQYRSKNGDRVDSKRIYDSKGRLLRLSFFNESEDGSIIPASLDGISHLVFRYNDKCISDPAFFSSSNEEDFKEDCFEAGQFNAQGSLDFRHGVRYIPERGWEIRRSYRDEPGTRNAKRRESRETLIQYQKLEFNFNGNLILNEYQGAYVPDSKGILREKAAADEENIAKVVQNYDLLSDRTLEEYYDAGGRLRGDSQKTARTVFVYDSVGNPIMKIYTDEKGLQAKDRYDVYKTVYEYDYSLNRYGLLKRKLHFGKSEAEPAEGDAGISKYEYQYDEKCIQSFPRTRESALNFSCIKEISYKGKDDRLKGNRNRKKTALARFQYDEKGRLSAEEYFGENGLPKAVREGISSFHYKYSEMCWEKMKSYDESLPLPKCRETDISCKSGEELVLTCVNEIRTLNSSGFPEADIDGAAVLKYRYDEGCLVHIHNKKECISEEEHLDSAENRTVYPRERTRIHYNENCLGAGNPASECISFEEFYGSDGKLKTDVRLGYARKIREYDEKGNSVLEEFFSSDGKPTEIKEGYFCKRTEYSDHTVSETFYGTDSLLKENSLGYAQKKMRYSEKGMHILSEYFDRNGKLTENKSGYAVKKFEYSPLNQLILEETYGKEGKLTDKNGSYARKIWKYDDRGNRILHEVQNSEGNPAFYKEGYSRKTSEYDSQGRMTAENYFGRNREPVLNRDGYSRKELIYNDKGKIIMEKYFGTDGRLKENILGYVQKKIDYNDMGLQILSEYYGADGKLKKNASGYARKIMNYDREGNRTLEETYDSQGELTEKIKDASYARKILKYSPDCLRKGKDHILKNSGCIAGLELYDKNEVLISARKSSFSKEGNFQESKEIPDQRGTKKWSLFQNRLRFEEKMETVSETKAVKKEDGYEEKKKEYAVLTEARYYMEFPNPKGREGKKKTVVELDRLYRPVRIFFE